MIDIEKTSTQHEAVIIALLSKPTISQAAQAAGVSESTVYRLLSGDGFCYAYRQARQRAFDQAIGRLQRVSAKAVDALESVLDAENAPHHARTSAALGVLKLAREGIELDDLVERVKRLERALESKTWANFNKGSAGWNRRS